MKVSRVFLVGLLVGAFLSGALVFAVMKQRFATNSRLLEHSFAVERANLIDSVRQSGLMNLMGPLLEKVEKELDESIDRSLSDETISQLRALSEGFRPYAIINPNAHQNYYLSPERGHLILMLTRMNMDLVSKQKILDKISFNHADLNGADLNKAMLKNVKLNYANLQNANLQGANLSAAQIRNSNLKGANLSYTDLNFCDLTSSDLSWADLNNASLKEATLNGSIVSSANIRNADLYDVSAQRTIFHNSFLDRADFRYADLIEAEFDKAHLHHTNFQNAYIVFATFRETTLSETILDSAIVKNDHWYTNLIDWNVDDLDKVKEKYAVENIVKGTQTEFRIINKKPVVDQ